MLKAIDGIDSNDQEKLLGELGQLNLHLLEQVRNGQIQPQMKILEIGCGYGHNIRFFIKHGYDAYGIDKSEEAIQLIKEYLPGWNPSLKTENFQVAEPLTLPFQEGFFDYTYALHFSEFTNNADSLAPLLKEALRVVKPSGVLFLQLETNIGLEGKVLHLTGNRYLMQDGQEKILISETELNNLVKSLNCNSLLPMTTLMYHSKKSYTFLTLLKK
jgi:tellurite methyltransferase